MNWGKVDSDTFTLHIVCVLCGLKGTGEVESYDDRPMTCPGCGMTTLIPDVKEHPDWDSGMPF